jgi:hypothetical protein
MVSQIDNCLTFIKGVFMNLSPANHNRLVQSWWLLKYTYGLLFVVAGADKYMNLVTEWQKYISPLILNMIPLSAQQFIWGVGIVEIIIGILILAIATRIGAYLAMAWLLIIVLNLLSMGTYFDIAVRDTVMAIGALVLALLTDVHEELK